MANTTRPVKSISLACFVDRFAVVRHALNISKSISYSNQQILMSVPVMNLMCVVLILCVTTLKAPTPAGVLMDTRVVGTTAQVNFLFGQR